MRKWRYVRSVRCKPKTPKGLVGCNGDTVVFRRKSGREERVMYRRKYLRPTESEDKLVFFRGYPQLSINYESWLRDVDIEE